jgi:hypothetical protein
MMNLELATEEQVLLEDILDTTYRNLKEEINKSEAFEFKAQLKAREKLIVGLLDRVRELSSSASSATR